MCTKPFVQEMSLTFEMHNYYSTFPKLLHDFFFACFVIEILLQEDKRHEALQNHPGEANEIPILKL